MENSTEISDNTCQAVNCTGNGPEGSYPSCYRWEVGFHGYYNQYYLVSTRNRPVRGFGCRTGNSRKLILFPVSRILPDFAGPEIGVFGLKF